MRASESTFTAAAGPSVFPINLHASEIGIYIAEQPAPAPHLAYSEGCAVLRIALVTVPRVTRSCEHFPDGFDLHLLPLREKSCKATVLGLSCQATV